MVALKFPQLNNSRALVQVVFACTLLLILQACATHQAQLKPGLQPIKGESQKPTHTIFLAGGFGEIDSRDLDATIAPLKQELSRADTNSTLIFTGDNITPDPGNWTADSLLINQQLSLAKDFKGNVIFLPGNNEWKSFDTGKIEKVEDYLKEQELEGIEVLPENVCPIEHQEINDQLDLILIDSKWFVSNWGRVEGINKKCTDINTHRRFFEELEGYINDGQGKNIVIAMHHPVFSNGEYAGKRSLKSHLTPLPVLGSVVYGFEQLGAFSSDIMIARRYRYLRIIVTALAKASDRITVVSGHEESLQYLKGGDIHQIISGALGKAGVTKRSFGKISTVGGSLDYEGIYTHGSSGFAKLSYYEDGSSKATFFSPKADPVHVNVLTPFEVQEVQTGFKKPSGSTAKDAVLTEYDALNKSGLYRFLWGERYRKYFGTYVEAPVAYLDTLYGGLEVVKKGGGHQSFSIRLKDKQGKEYSMRSLRKNALKFLKFKVQGIAYTEDDYKDSWAEEVISDFFTTAHPYMQLVVNPLARAINVNHSSPTLFYIPRQERLGELNREFGNELYFIEERPSDEQMNFRGYRRALDEAGKIKDFESTTDMLEKIKEDEKYAVDERDFIRARLFDMLIGDWDRHQDQWRWVEYEIDDDTRTFLPVPRDRDNVFPKFDGVAMELVKWFVPDARSWQTYGPEIKNLKWLNFSGNNLDRVLTTASSGEVWEEEAAFIVANLSKEDVTRAFSRLPEAVQDNTTAQLQRDLLQRLERLPEYAREYSAYLDKLIVLHGTEKDDIIEVTRLANGDSKVVIKRKLSDEPNPKVYERVFSANRTKEIWIYGLGDDDEFIVTGSGDPSIFIRLIGGYGEDDFAISAKGKLKVYDWKHEKINFDKEKPAVHLTNLYNTHNFHWRNFEENTNILVPNLGFRTDDGFYFGASNTYTNNGFNGNPFRQKHRLAANYFSKFEAVELSYDGIFANVFPGWNFETNAYYTSDKYAKNFFGFGNETVNLEDTFGRDYYRARLRQVQLSAGIAYHTLRFRGVYESFRAQEVEGRLFVPANVNPVLFENQHYIGAETSLAYWNDDAPSFPTRSLSFGLTGGYKINPNRSDNQFGYLRLNLGFGHKLIPSGNLVLATKAEFSVNFGDEYFFYHAPSLGGNNGLRGFRDERFTGDSYFYQTSDLRVRLKRIVTAAAPVTVGIYGGFDYGRVWLDTEDSTTWHTSQGGGMWISALNFWALKAGYFNSVDGNIIQVGLGVDF